MSIMKKAKLKKIYFSFGTVFEKNQLFLIQTKDDKCRPQHTNNRFGIMGNYFEPSFFWLSIDKKEGHI